MIVPLDATRYHESEAFVKQPTKLYQLRIQHQHYQLRHFISTSDAGVVYYAHKSDVYALYTPSGKRERIASLDFQPVCFAAAYGWVCAGSNEGTCVFIDVQGRAAEVDSLLPLHLDPAARDGLPSSSSSSRQWPQPMQPKPPYHSIGNDILNSITIYRMKSEDNDIIDDEDIAVISTNEKAIHIYSLQRLQAIKVIQFPVHMNHASISPDGTLLVACGDKEEAFFCRRIRVPGVVVDKGKTFAAWDWQQFAQVRLPSPVQHDTCFSTAFSPSGHVCSIASQNGIVTIFDVSRIREGMEDGEAIVDHFTSSRPASVPEEIARWTPGAVRSSAFSPSPWDLFAWAEDRGRVCIADMRDGFRTRQLLELDPDSSDLQRCEVTELELNREDSSLRDLESTFLRSHRAALNARDPRTATIQNNADLIERSVERARRDVSGSWTLQSGEPSSTEREAFEARAERHADSRSEVEIERPFRPSVSGVASSANQQTSSLSPNSNVSVRQYIRERSSTQTREGGSSGSARTLPPRRRSSVVLSGSRGGSSGSQHPDTQEASSSASHPSSLLPTTASNNALSASPSRLGSSTQSPSWASEQSSPNRETGTEAWRTITAALTQATANDPPSSITDANRRSRLQSLSRHESVLVEEQQALERRRRDRQRELQAGTGGSDSGPLADPAALDPYPGDESYSASLLRRPAYLGTSTNTGDGDDAEITLVSPISGATDIPTSSGQEDEDNDGLASYETGLMQRDREGVLALSARMMAQDQQVLIQRLAARDALARDATRRQHLETLLAGNRRAVSRQEQMLDRAERGLEAIHSGQLRRLHERARQAEDRLAAGTRANAAALSDLMRDAESLAGTWPRRDAREREERSEHGVAIMGLGWSRDGRQLYVGTEEGIFEFQVELGSRRYLPSITPR